MIEINKIIIQSMPVSDEQHLKNLKKNKVDELKEIRRKNKEYETGMKYRKELVSIHKSRQDRQSKLRSSMSTRSSPKRYGNR